MSTEFDLSVGIKIENVDEIVQELIDKLGNTNVGNIINKSNGDADYGQAVQQIDALVETLDEMHIDASENFNQLMEKFDSIDWESIATKTDAEMLAMGARSVGRESIVSALQPNVMQNQVAPNIKPKELVEEMQKIFDTMDFDDIRQRVEEHSARGLDPARYKTIMQTIDDVERAFPGGNIQQTIEDNGALGYDEEGLLRMLYAVMLSDEFNHKSNRRTSMNNVMHGAMNTTKFEKVGDNFEAAKNLILKEKTGAKFEPVTINEEGKALKIMDAGTEIIYQNQPRNLDEMVEGYVAFVESKDGGADTNTALYEKYGEPMMDRVFNLLEQKADELGQLKEHRERIESGDQGYIQKIAGMIRTIAFFTAANMTEGDREVAANSMQRGFRESIGTKFQIDKNLADDISKTLFQDMEKKVHMGEINEQAIRENPKLVVDASDNQIIEELKKMKDDGKVNSEEILALIKSILNRFSSGFANHASNDNPT